MKPLVFISGASSGIGKACAEIFALNGYRLILNARRADRLEQMKNDLQTRFGSEVFLSVFDVRDREQVEKAISDLPSDWNEIDVLLNNAGLALGLSSIQEGDVSQWDTMIDTNVKGLLYVTRSIAPILVKRKKGHIVNIGSTAGKEVYPNGNVYCGTKFAVGALSQSMRVDLLPHGIHVTLVNPGAVETEFSKVRFSGDEEEAAKVYLGFEPLKAEDIAEVVYFAVSRPDHVNIAEITVMPNAQASSLIFNKQIQ